MEGYPQRWFFHREEIAVDIDENTQTGELEVMFLDESVHKKFGRWYEVTQHGIAVLRSHLRRLKDLYKEELKEIEEGTSKLEIPQHELEPLMSYYHALAQALELTVEASKAYLSANDDVDDDDEDDDDDDDEDDESQ